jgi:hypothetical protein
MQKSMRYLISAFCILHFAFTAAAQTAEVSTFVVPITMSLAPLLPELEKQVPKTFAKLDAYELEPKGRFGMKYKVQRDPIALQMIGTGLHATTTVHYALEGCARAKNPITGSVRMFPCLSCGFGEPMREAFISLHSHFDWDANWRLLSKTTARPVEFPNKCGVTILNINVSDWKLAPLVNQQLAILTRSIDANTPKLANIRPLAQQVWNSLQTPTELAPRTWLVLEPLDAALGTIRGNGLNAGSTLTLHARTRVVVGDRPPVALKPLPPLRKGEEAAGAIRVPFTVELPYTEASRLLNEQFAGKKIADVLVQSVQLAPAPNGRIAIDAMVDMKRYRGKVTLEGTPQFDPATSTLSITDLDYQLAKKSLFVRIADRFTHDTLRQRLRENAHWTVTNEVANIRANIDKAMTRPLAPGVMLNGHVTSVQPDNVAAAADRVIVHVTAIGTAGVTIDGAVVR